MVIITTVGTSLLTNIIKNEISNKECFKIDTLTQTHKKKISDGNIGLKELNNYSDEFNMFINGLENPIEKYSKYKKDEKYELNINASAEIKSICKIANGEQATVYLLATDTFMSEFAAEKIKETLNKEEYKLGVKFEKEKHKINGLKIDNSDEFQQSGFEKLIGAIDEIYAQHKKDNVILNISGGYKALIPFLTIYGQLKSLTINYIYEESNQLIEIQPLPISFKYEEVSTQAIFLKKEFFKLLKEQVKLLNSLIFENTFKINQNKISYTDKPENIIKNSKIINSLEELKEKKNTLDKVNRLIINLKNNKLIDIDNKDELYITPVGILFRNYANDKISGEFGHIIETKISEKIENENDLKTKLCINEIIEIKQSYKKIKGKFYINNGIFQLGKSTENDIKNIDIGDIDIWIKHKNKATIIEVKAYSETLGFINEKDTDSDYFYKIKARVLKTKDFLREQNDNRKIEYIFLVYKIMFDELHDDFEMSLNEIKQYFTDKFANCSYLKYFTFKFNVVKLSTPLAEFNYNKLKDFENVNFNLINRF